MSPLAVARQVLLLLFALTLLLGAGQQSVAHAEPLRPPTTECGPDEPQGNGSIYRYCVPEGWEGGALLLYAHGYRWFNEPLEIPEEHLCFGTGAARTCLHELLNGFGIAFAVTSYPTNGLAVLPGVEDMVRLAEQFSAAHGSPSVTLIGGVSEGGLVATLALERYPERFDGALAVCGPIGSWQGQLAYFGDFRVLLDYFFPDISPFPADTLAIPDSLIEAWGEGLFEKELAPALLDPANRERLQQLLDSSQLPYVTEDPETTRLALHDALAYNIMATNEVTEKLGGNPYDNRGRVYEGTADDAALNAGVRRWQAAPAALEAMEALESSGLLERPLVSLHTSRDQQVPHWHEPLYGAKVRAQGRAHWYLDHPMPVDQFGHCRVDLEQELLPAFFTLLERATAPRATLFLPVARPAPGR